MSRFHFFFFQEMGVLELSQADIQKEINSANALADQHRQSNIVIKFRNALFVRSVLLVSNVTLNPSLPRDLLLVHIERERVKRHIVMEPSFSISIIVVKCSKFQVNKRVVMNGFHPLKFFQSKFKG